MGGGHALPRVQHPIPPPAPRLQWDQDDHRQRSHKSTGTQAGGGHPPGEECHRETRSTDTTRWVLLNIFFGYKKRWRFSSYTGLKRAQHLSESVTIPYAADSRCATNSKNTKLVHFNRSKGRLLSRPYSRTPQAVSALRFRRQGLPIQGAPVRDLPGSSYLHEMYAGSIGTDAGPWHANPPVLGRLACLCSNQGAGGAGHSYPYTPCDAARPYSQLQKELSCSQPECCIHRLGLGLSPNACLSHSSTSGGHSKAPSLFSEEQEAEVQPFPQAARDANISDSGGATGSPTFAAIPSLGKWPSSRPQIPQGQDGQGVQQLPSHTTALERQGVSDQGCPFGVNPLASRVSSNRCLRLRVGRSVATQSCEGALDKRGSDAAHKCARASCNISGTSTVYTTFEGQARARAVRQQVSCLPHKSPGGHQIDSVVTGGTATPHVGFPPLFQSESYVPARATECGGRLSVTTETSLGGVETPPRGSGADLAQIRHSRGGPVCNRVHNAMPSLVLPDGDIESVRAGCSGAPMARLPPVCFSTFPTNSIDTTQGPGRQPQTPAGRSKMAREDVVLDAAQSLLQLSMAAPQQEGSPVSVGRPHLASVSGTPAAVCMAPEGPEPLLSQCDQDVIQTILDARAPSTRALYANRWKLFSQWCEVNREVPESCSVPVILRYLQSLMEKKLSASTLKVYVAAISARHSKVDNQTVGSHTLVTRFLRGVRRRNPLQAVRHPSWDLTLVLEALRRPPYEPMQQSELKWASAKLAFLLAMASAKRVSELHALSVSTQCMRWNSDGTGVALWPNPSFLSKTWASEHSNKVIQLAAYNPSGLQESAVSAELVCPVRALRHYIQATEGLRHSDSLFVCYGGHRRGHALSKQRLSKWVVMVIEEAYKARGLPVPHGLKCHSTRGVSTSWAALRGVPLSEICAAATWAAPCTFARFYNVNVAATSGVAAAVLGVP